MGGGFSFFFLLFYSNLGGGGGLIIPKNIPKGSFLTEQEFIKSHP